MTKIEIELQELKNEIVLMWKLVSQQMKKAMECLATMDKKLAAEILENEKKVNSAELQIDSNCENFFALFNPVAIDLRLVLALLRINTSLEKVGDIAASIAKFVKKADDYDYALLLSNAHALEMFEEAADLLVDVQDAFETENSQLAISVFPRDKALNQLNRNARTVIIEHIKKDPEKVEQCLKVLSIIRKLERAGDQSKTIAEEIIYYIDAKVLKHGPKNVDK
jgi:phosphate transport system protein